MVTVDVMRPQLGAMSPAALVNGDPSRGDREVRTIEEVERFEARLHAPSSRQAERLDERQIGIDQSGPIKLLRPRLPRWPAGGISNALMSQ